MYVRVDGAGGRGGSCLAKTRRSITRNILHTKDMSMVQRICVARVGVLLGSML